MADKPKKDLNLLQTAATVIGAGAVAFAIMKYGAKAPVYIVIPSVIVGLMVGFSLDYNIQKPTVT